MIRSADTGRDQVTEHPVAQVRAFVLLPVPDISDVHHAGQHRLNFDCSILTKDPVESVIVVVNRRVSGEDQFPSAPRLQSVPPEEPAIPFVDGYGSRSLQRIAAIIGYHGTRKDGVGGSVVERDNGIAAVRRQSVIAFVLRIPGAVRGIAIGSDHLGDRRAVKNRAPPRAVFVGHIVQFQAPARMNSVMETPVLPPDLRPLHPEAGPIRLKNLQGAQWIVRPLSGGRGRRREEACILKPRHRSPGQIDVHIQAHDSRHG